MAFNLKKVLKSMLLASSQPLGAKEIQAAFNRFHSPAGSPEPSRAPSGSAVPEAKDGATEPAAAVVPAPEEPVMLSAAEAELYEEVPTLITAAQIREAMDAIAVEVAASDEGLHLIEGANGYRLVTHPRYARWVRALRAEPAPAKLSPSSLETLAVVAYRQPVTRTEIEAIRGVSAEAGVTKLLERELIYITGRADQPGRPLQYGTTDKFLEYVGIKSIDELPASDVLSSRQVDQWLQDSTNAPKLDDTSMGLADEQLPLDATPAPTGGPAHTAETAETAGTAERANGS